MSKLSKLMKTPGPFFRDMLVKRYPLRPLPPGGSSPPSQLAPASKPALTPRQNRTGSAAPPPRSEPQDVYAPIRPALPTDHARQTTSEGVAGEVLGTTRVATIVDLGCGSGVAFDWISARKEAIQYIGVDIEWSPQVAKRTRRDARFVTYDGVNLPFDDATVEMIYTNQVLEHVRDPFGLMADIARVLRPGGYFVGSVSQMEPYHSYSVFNWTIFGVHHVFAESGLALRLLRPGIDVCSLVDWWRHPRDRALYAPYWRRESALNHQIDLLARANEWTVARTNLEKLLYAGQICFIAQRAADSAPAKEGAAR